MAAVTEQFRSIFVTEEDGPKFAADPQKELLYVGEVDVMASQPHATYNWVDITNDFNNAVKGLEMGELLHDDLFGLFEAMSAIEMMDPKMDAGMLCNRGSKTALSFDQAVAAGSLKLKDISAAEQISIVDSTLSCLVSWLEGHSLAQTVFTNLYLHKPHMIEDRVVKAFSIAVFKIVDLIKDFVNRALVFEEEDFQPMVYGYRLTPDVTDARAMGMLKEAEEELHRRARATPIDPSEHEDLLAVHARIKFTRLLHGALAALARREPPGAAECQRLLSAAADLLAVMQRTVGRGASGDSDADHHVTMGFDPLVNHRLLPPTFPRYTKIKSRADALDYFEELLVRLKLVCKITSYTSFHSALDFFVEFSRQGPCILSRSTLQLLYLPQSSRVFGSLGVVDVLRDAARTFICPPALAAKSTLLNNPQAREYVDSFLAHCARPFGALVHACGHNRARQRDKLAQLLDDFAALQDEAERVDAFLHDLSLKADVPRPHLACFGTWILYHTLRVMVMYLLAGFELELYSTHEYHYVFWYLYEFLFGWLVSALSRADSFLAEQEALAEAAANAKGGRGAGKRSKGKKKKARPYGHEITVYQALQNICGGFYKAMVGFRIAGKVPQPHPEFDNERVRYEHRFAPFAALLTPPPVQYAEFREMTAPRGIAPPSSTGNFLVGCQHFHKARSLLETIPSPDNEVTSLLKVSKTNFVVLKLLAGGHKKDSTTPPEFDFSGHSHFPIIKLT